MKNNDKPVILLVEDNKEIQEFIAANLEDCYGILTAMQGAAALEVLAQETVHLIVSDVMMPVMDGFELCRRVKSDVELSHLPFVLLTAKDTLQSKIEGLELGADVYIEKPFSPKYLRMQIASLLENRNKVKAHYANSPIALLKSMAHNRSDEKFLEMLDGLIVQHMQDPQLDVEHLARFLNMSRRTLYRKISAITDLSPNELINLSKLKKAAELVINDQYSLQEIAEITGYNSAKIFSRNFEKQFGISPAEYARTRTKKSE